MNNDDWWVHDARNGRVLGPYSAEDAQKFATDLNDFVHRNGPLGFLTAVSIVGPFYARPTRERLF